MRGQGLRFVAGMAITTVIACALAACGSTARAPSPTVPLSSAAPSPAPTSPLSTDVTRTVENVVLACREKDGETLRTLIAGDVAQQQIDALFALGRDVALRSQTTAVTGDQASVAVDLQIERDTGADNVQRTWQLSRGADDLWRLASLPDCY